MECINIDFGEDFELFVYPASGSSSGPADAATAPSITTTELPHATVGTAYSFQLSASASATWTIKGKLPAGLSMNSSGLITGTPTKDGKKKITFTAENSAGKAKKTLTFTVYGRK
ncbi:MAG: putative Ig domain-containing protein [Synergistaceae bacterium]|nr:putative Ig domain-containing protein [Synergistaceae bacterium]